MPNKVLVVDQLEKTGSACPSQWEAKLDDGRMLYIRYRWGRLTVEVSRLPTDDIFDAVGANLILDKRFGGAYDGTLSTDEMKSHCSRVLQFNIDQVISSAV